MSEERKKADAARGNSIRKLFKAGDDSTLRDHLIVQGASVELAKSALAELKSKGEWTSPFGGTWVYARAVGVSQPSADRTVEPSSPKHVDSK